MKTHKRIPCSLAVLTLLVLACGTDSATSPDNGIPMPDVVDPGPGLDTPATDPGEGPVDTGPPPQDCQALLKADSPFDLFYALPSGQIHAAAAFDGEAVWMTFNVPEDDGTGGFDVWAARVKCDGSFAIAPFKAQVQDLGNDVDPDLCVRDGNVYLAWHTDTGGDPNLVIHYRAFRNDGTPIMESERRLEPALGGQAQVTSMWLPRVAGLPGGRFALTGSWASESAQRFQVFVQTLLSSGDTEGDAMEVLAEPGISQLFPSLASGDQGGLALAYTREDDAESRVVHTAFTPEGSGLSWNPPVQATNLTGGAAALSIGPGTDGPVFLAFHTTGDDMDVVVTDGASHDPAAPFATFGAPQETDHTPGVAAGPSGGAVMWFRVRSGIRNDVLIQRFDTASGSITAQGNERLLNPEGTTSDHAAPPVYNPAITHLFDHVYFTSWSEGTSPEFRLKGRFVDLK